MKIEELIIKVIDLSDEGKYKEALKICDSIIESNSDYDRVYFERGVIYLNQERDELALLDFEKLLKINPDYPGAKDWYSKTLSDLGRNSKAATVKLEELRSQPDGKYGMGVSPNDWAECARNFIEAGYDEIAKSVLEEYFNQYEPNVRNYKSYETAPIRVYAKLLLSLNKKELALSESGKAIDSQHTVPADYEVYIEALIENNQTEKASIEINKYVSEIHDGYETSKIVELKKRIK
ncbi:hypothetical protein GCM10011506_06570 [Marivirga lumbricoides]|uniref:Tetratricopeptide repeat protein n=1 Tax=Marivirga lumbricoides TaxID=1046115 RepID=A0ABQ1LFQ3_9BACT|nr:hypothetical protein GCM10011506_06570 [Marivirga lumbricoides]